MQTYRLTGFPNSSNLRIVSEDRNSLRGGSSCGNSCIVTYHCNRNCKYVGWVAMGAGWHRCSSGTNELFGEDRYYCSLGRIAGRVPVS